MCLTPKLIYVRSAQGKKRFPLVVPCGKCYDCQNAARGEFALKCRYERDHCAACYFCTFTYTDENLTPAPWNYFNGNIKFSNLLRAALQEVARIPIDQPNRYGKFLLNMNHAKQLVKDINTRLQRISPAYRVRYALVGEYGTFSSRPHFHALFFFPCFLSKKQVEEMLLQLWRYGNVEVDSITDSSINYVGKHFVKDDNGTPLQQKLAPRFLLQCNYHGGLGNGLKNDRFAYNNYLNDNKAVVSGNFKLLIPRSILRIWQGEKKFTDTELEEKSKKNISNFAMKYFEKFQEKCFVYSRLKNSVDSARQHLKDLGRMYSYTFDRSVFDSTEFSDIDISFSDVLRYNQSNFPITFNKNLHYKRCKFQKKVLSLRRKGYLNDDGTSSEDKSI